MRTKKKAGSLDPVVLRSEVVKRLKRPKDIGVLAEELGVKRSVIAGELRALKQNGYQIDRVGDTITLHRTVAQTGTVSPVTLSLKRTGETRFGIISDTHLGSKFERLDILEAAYDHFAKAGIENVYHAGNLVDGESVVNRYDLKVHGLVDQTHYALDHYPQRKNITTHFIDGDDHEGWWTRREGIRFGPYLEMAAREVDRNDLRYLGYAEADVSLQAPWMKKPAIMRITHPGGGSAYATSYKAQKTVESYGPNEKPDILVVGHYHKMGVFRPRSVWSILAGCTQDQSTFMRKLGLEAHLGWLTVGVCQDKNGAAIGLNVQMFQGFDRAYYK